MSVEPRTLVRASLAAVLLAAITHVRADPDLWGHVRFGGDILASGTLPATDTYSFMSDRMWINHEWLAECAMSIAYTIGGGPGLAGLKFLTVLAMLALIWFELQRQGVDGASRDLLLALAIIGTFPQANHVRPQVFSLVAFAGLVVCLLRSDGSRRWLLLIPPIFAMWVNLHGGWIVGGGVLAVWAVMSLFRPAAWSQKLLLFVVSAASLLATLANPYGWEMWTFLGTTVGFGRVEITDWQPVYRLGPAYVALWILLALAAMTGMVRAFRSGSWDLRSLTMVVVLGAASFRVSRLLAFFAITIVLCLGQDLARALQARRAGASAPALAMRRLKPARYAAVVAMLIAAFLIAGGGVMAVRNLGCVRLVAEQPEPDVVRLVKERGLRGRLVVWFDWGEYAIWYFAPELRVSIDGRRETVYSDEVMQRHLEFYYSPASRAAFLDAARADHAWLPADLPVVSSLLADGWQPVYRGLRSVWLSREAGVRAVGASGGTGTAETGLGRRCFPGP